MPLFAEQKTFTISISPNPNQHEIKCAKYSNKVTSIVFQNIDWLLLSQQVFKNLHQKFFY